MPPNHHTAKFRATRRPCHFQLWTLTTDLVLVPPWKSPTSPRVLQCSLGVTQPGVYSRGGSPQLAAYLNTNRPSSCSPFRTCHQVHHSWSFHAQLCSSESGKVRKACAHDRVFSAKALESKRPAWKCFLQRIVTRIK